MLRRLSALFCVAVMTVGLIGCGTTETTVKDAAQGAADAVSEGAEKAADAVSNAADSAADAVESATSGGN